MADQLTDDAAPLPLPDDKQALLNQLFAGLPPDFDGRVRALNQIRWAFHEKVAAALEPVLNEHVRHLPKDTLQDRRKLANWVDETTRSFGVTTVSPRERRPALFAAFLSPLSSEAEQEPGMFAFLVRNTYGQIIIENTSTALPALALGPAPNNLESMYRRQRRAYSPEPER